MIGFQEVTERKSFYKDCQQVLQTFPHVSYRILDITEDGRVHVYIHKGDAPQEPSFFDPNHTYVIHCKGLTRIQALAKIHEKVSCYLKQDMC